MKFRTALSSGLLLVAILSASTLYAAELIDINTANLATLEVLKGIGASKAQAIIDYRTKHGAFAAVADIQNVSGIGPVTYANIKDFITVGTTTPPVAPPASAIGEPKPAQVVIQSAPKSKPAPQVAPKVVAAATSAASTARATSSAALWPILGLIGVVGVGSLGALYARPRPSGEETEVSAEEFEIVE